MKIRKRLFPRTMGDIGAFVFICSMVPITYVFELLVVLPHFYEMWSYWYTVHFLGFTFLLINVVGSLVATMLIDTSIEAHFIPSVMKSNWHVCAVCEAICPPRSWHCNVCDTCILKRDHHCIFTGCCIGHYNSRFFIMFLVYLWIGAFYCTRFNCVFTWSLLDTTSPLLIFKMMFPFAVVLFGIDASQKQCFLLIFLVDFIAMLFTASLTYYHVGNLLKGSVTYERNRNIYEYDLGKKQNIAQVFGNRWYISWLSPFIPSELPHDGINWENVTSAGTDRKRR